MKSIVFFPPSGKSRYRQQKKSHTPFVQPPSTSWSPHRHSLHPCLQFSPLVSCLSEPHLMCCILWPCCFLIYSNINVIDHLNWSQGCVWFEGVSGRGKQGKGLEHSQGRGTRGTSLVPEFSELLCSSQFANTVDMRRLQQEQGMYRQSPNS